MTPMDLGLAAFVISLLVQAVAYGRLIQKVDNIGNKLVGVDGNGGIVAKVVELDKEVGILKAVHKESCEAHSAGL